ncbi:MAG: ABC transporter permease [Pirellulaceae bacterium]
MQRLLTDYGMIVVLVALCLLFSVLTLKHQVPEGRVAVAELAEEVQSRVAKTDVILAVGAARQDTAKLAQDVGRALQERGYSHTRIVVGTPRDLRLALDDITQQGQVCAAIVTGGKVANWRVIEQIPVRYPASADFQLLTPRQRLWPDFLKRTNLLAIVDRIVVIAVIAVGMTMVIITGGIDLSVGSLIALSAVIATLVMKQLGGLTAPAWAVGVGFLVGTLACGVVGGLGGLIVARFKVAPFITTLAVMMMARGLAFLITGGFSIYQVPAALSWLGQGRSLGMPNTVILLVSLYAVAHIFMSHTRLGRYIYAVGGNEEAARLSGVPVGPVIVFVYVVSALSAGLGGCIQASQINTGTPTMGVMYELYVIAAVVVGGTSLAGGTGRVLGTLIGAFIISVIQNGMNLLGMESYTQQVVLGGVILGAVLLDKVRSGQSLAGFWKANASG